MSQPITCPKCGSDDLAFFTKRNEYQCDCGCRFKPEKAPRQPMRIFLSYGHDRNEELVVRIKSDLEMLGHDVWLDREEIKFGDDWRRTITDGIRGSDWMFSFLSKHSTRDPGVCLDELGIALGVKGGIIQTILVESEDEVFPPVSISHLQWLDMHDWQDRQQTDPAGFAAWYAAKFAEIRRVLESETNQRFAGEIELLSEKLKPVTMDAFTARLLEKGFSGRKWLVDELEDWLQQEPASRAFVLTGEPGIGKSAFAAWLAHYNKAEVLAAVFMRYNQPQSCDPTRVICSIAFQLACRLPDYRKQLIHLAELADLDGKNESELFTYLLAEPLRSCINGNRGNGVILIDALDEAPAGGAGVAELLARHAQELPTWLKIVATTRPEPRLLSVLAALHPRKIDADDLRNRRDIADYLQKQLAVFSPSSKIIDAIIDKSEGIFLYAEQVVAQVLDRGLSLDRIDKFPDGLPGIYTQYFQRQFPDIDRYYATTALALQVLLAAQEPLSREELASILDWDETTIHRQLLALGSLFPETGGMIQPFHRSLGEWLTAHEQAGDYFVSLRDGHSLLATAGWGCLKNLLSENVAESPLDYAVLYVGAHLYAGGEEDALEEMVQRIVTTINNGVPGYEEVFGKLIDWVVTHENYVAESRFKKNINTATKHFTRREVAVVLHNRARKLRKIGYGEWALFLYETVLHVYSGLTRRKPNRTDLLHERAVLFDDVGRIYQAWGDGTRALEMYQNALAIQEELIEKEPMSFRLKQELAGANRDIGRIYGIHGDGTRALERYQSALTILKEQVERNPEGTDSLYYLANTYNDVGGIYKAQGEDTRALEMYQEALIIRETLVVKEPDRTDLRRDLSFSYNSFGDIYKAQGNSIRALEMYQNALTLQEVLVAKEPECTDLRRDLGFSYDSFGDIYEAQGEDTRALEMYQEALIIREALVVKEPDRTDLRRELSFSYNSFGDIYKAQGNSIRALEMYQNALTLQEVLLAKEPERTDLRRDLSVTHNRVASIYEAQGEDTRALKMYQETLIIREALVVKEPKRLDLRRDLSISYDKVGSIYEAQGDGSCMMEMYQNALTIDVELVVEEPERADLQISLATSCWNIYRVCKESEKHYWLDLAHSILKSLKENGVDYVNLNQLLKLVEQELVKYDPSHLQ